MLHLNTTDQLGKFDETTSKGTFLRYSYLSKAYRVFNKRSLLVKESINVTFCKVSGKSTNDENNEDVSTV